MSCLSLFAAAPGDPLSALSGPMLYFVIGLVFIVLAGMTMLLTVLRFFKRCPSNRVLVIFGRTGKGQARRTIHGGELRCSDRHCGYMRGQRGRHCRSSGGWPGSCAGGIAR